MRLFEDRKFNIQPQTSHLKVISDQGGLLYKTQIRDLRPTQTWKRIGLNSKRAVLPQTITPQYYPKESSQIQLPNSKPFRIYNSCASMLHEHFARQGEPPFANPAPSQTQAAHAPAILPQLAASTNHCSGDSNQVWTELKKCKPAKAGSISRKLGFAVLLLSFVLWTPTRRKKLLNG